jgi:hypothetical protein
MPLGKNSKFTFFVKKVTVLFNFNINNKRIDSADLAMH